ncbi:MAG TPA: tetratricopeptide repeat protein [Chthonomonadales bacterium]|nr:tetratricopeptide repeat protein [Chthonomonadales bacterium]
MNRRIESAAATSSRAAMPRIVPIAAAGLLLVGAAMWLRSSSLVREYIWSHASLAGLQQAIPTHESDSIAQYYLGKRLYMAGRMAEAKEAYKAAEALDPRSGRIHLGLGMAYDQNGQYDRAQSELEEALRCDPSLAWAQFMLGKIAWDAEDFPTALTHLKKAVELSPKSAQSWYSLGACYAKLKQIDPAISALRTSVSLAPRDPRGITSLGELLIYSGQGDAGAKDLEEAIRLDPSYGPAYSILGRYLFLNGETAAEKQQAQQLLERAVSMPSTGVAEVYFDLGQIYLRNRNYRAAVADLQRSVRLDPSKERTYYALSSALRADGQAAAAMDTEKSLAALNKNQVQLARIQLALRTHPDDLNRRLLLARCYRDVGRRVHALREYAFILSRQQLGFVDDEYHRVLADKEYADGLNRTDYASLAPQSFATAGPP